ncbi:CxxxxCH/CxxCH domain-containing protein [Geotalea sp. SG265]|uniref:RCC1 domain-containing protein n=1 Tax=Geotalea sp. SG265 TaxID=2922867 RepID=UPI001FB0429F|nr:CxxxxCH/CxxCH domain-containing protein [Geotalea sp. SG265]
MSLPITAVRQCFALLILVILLALTATASAAIQCYDCHGVKASNDYRPLDAPYRNITSGGFPGNHRTHMPGPASPASCEPCHPGSSGYVTGHTDGVIKLSSDINNSPSTALYKNATSAFPQTSTPAFGTCSNVNCHFERKTPDWGSTPLTVPAGCGQCHGSPPLGGDTGAAGSHQTHDRYYPGATGCGQCHADHAGKQNPFAHATSAGRRQLIVSLHGPKGTPGGQYAGPLNDYLPKSQSNSFGRCTGTYCHSNGTSIATGAVLGNISTPVWGTGGLSCSGCHSYPPSYENLAPKANAHPRHNSFGLSCSRCHAGTTGDGTTITGPATHANASYDVASPAGETLSYSAAGSTCTNTYCHSSAQGITDPTQPALYAVANWNLKKTNVNGSGSGFTDGPTYWPRCDNCHNAGYHRYGMSPPMESGSHRKHLQYEVGRACNMCHYRSYYPDNSVCDQCHIQFWDHENSSARGSEHVNGMIDVVIHPNFPAPGAGGVYTGDAVPGTPYGSCNSLYCHSQGTKSTAPFPPANVASVAWGGPPLPNDCTGCHNGDGETASPMATGSHGRHLGYSCNRCHGKTVTTNRSAIPTTDAGPNLYLLPQQDTFTRHANGLVDVAFANHSVAIGGRYAGLSSPLTKAPGSLPGRCFNVYCHSTGTSVATGTIFGNISTPVWGTSRTFACDSCHGNPPAYPDTSPKANGHGNHTAYNCGVCHYGTTTDGSTITNQALHRNHAYDLSAAPGYSFTYASATASGSSCSSVSCHTPGSAIRAWSATNSYTITTTPTTNGTITASPSTVVYGGDSVCTIQPEAGYSVVDVSVDGKSVGAVTSYTFANVITNHTISATFKINTYTITALPMSNGTITVTPQTVDYGGNADCSIAPAAGYVLTDVLVDGQSVGPVTSYRFTNVTANHTISATTKRVYTISTYPADVVVCTPAVVDPGADSVCTITPRPGTLVGDVLVDYVSVGARNSYTFTNVTANHDIQASLKTAYTVTIAPDLTNGSITCSPTWVATGQSSVCSITPDPGYAPVDVTVDGKSVGPVDTYKFAALYQNHTISATFGPGNTIEIIPFANGSITCYPSTSVAIGGTTLCTAIADQGYSIASMTIDGTPVPDINKYTFSNVVAPHNITATAAAGIIPQLSSQNSHTLELQSDGTLWTFGANYNGELGNGTKTSSENPAQIGNGTNWAAVAAGKIHSVAVKRDGTLWAWGENSLGQVGDGSGVTQTSPVQIGTAEWAAVAAGTYHSVAIKRDGTLWAWGYNSGYQLGDGTKLMRTTPVKIGNDADWAAVAAGDTHSVALKKDGSLWAWGYNYYYQVGDGTMVAKTTPIRIGTESNWAAVAAADSQTLALKKDGTLWAWGRNYKGQLGDGTTIDRHVPVKIGSDTDWRAISTGTGIFGAVSMALKSDGSLWAWGADTYGVVGTDTTYTASPTKIGSDTDWAAVGAGTPFTALKNSGVIWVWGNPQTYYDRFGAKLP